MMCRAMFLSLSRSLVSMIFFSLCILCLFPASGDCRTPSNLAGIIQSFNHSNSLAAQLDLSYQGLDLYAPIDDKSSVDPADRASLSKMKRVVLTRAIADAGGDVLIAGIGSTGNWVARRPGMIVNDYPAGNQDKIVQLKLKGCYMEGLSDLDFVIMGSGAREYQSKIYRIFAEGSGGTHLTPAEMDELEINFITDDQIRSLAAGPQGRNFWKQLMDLSNSSSHAEKYITKGGKALYGMAHLYENGAVITLDKQNPAKTFAEYASQNGHKMGPFTLLNLFGGACDMDYFISHALNKSKQEEVKTVLQVIKYLKRDEWMLRRAAKNLGQLPNELTQRPGTIKILNNYAAEIARFTDSAIKKKVWKSSQATTQFGQEAQALAGLVCSSAHEMLIKIGYDLLSLRSLDKLTPTTSAILTSLVYDLRTVDEQRYSGKYPKWYAPEYNLTKDKPRDETLYFLKIYREGKKKEDGQGPVLSRAELKKNEEMELGPMVPPPVATIEITDTNVSPEKPTAGAPVTITISGTVHNVANELPDFSENQYSDKEKEYMKELGEWSLRASLFRMQISYLMNQDKLNNDPKSSAEKIYVSPYEIETLAEQLEVAEDEVVYLSQQMNRDVQEEKTGKYSLRIRSTPSAQSIDDYLDAMEKTCNQSKDLIEKTQTHAKSFLASFKSYSDSGWHENQKEYEKIAAQAETSLEALKGSLGFISEILKKRKQLTRLLDADPSTAADLAKEIETALGKISKETAASLVKAYTANADLSIAAAKTHQLLAGFVDNTQGQAVITGLKGSMAQWEAHQKVVSQSTIPDLEKKALWLKGGAWAAKGARWGFEAYVGYQDFKKNQKALATTDIGGGAEDAVLALTVAGKAMEKVIGIIPIPVLKNSLNGYAKILSDSTKWAVAVDSAQSKIYQGQGFDVRSTAPMLPAAYTDIIEHDRNLDPAQYYRTRMPLAEYNKFIVFAYPRREPSDPTRDRMWLVWNKHEPYGYSPIDKETYRKMSLYSAWYRRTYSENIAVEDLLSLLAKDKIETWYGLKADVTTDDIKRKAERLLELKSFSAYLKTLTNKKSFKGGELATYKTMLYHAAREFAKHGFLLADADIAEIMSAVLYAAPIEGNWQTLYDVLTMTSGNADEFNQAAKDWDRFTGGEKDRLETILKKQIKAKVDRRTEALERNWKEARLGGDDQKTIAAGLLFSEVGIVLNHALFSTEEGVYADDFLDISAETFTLSWKTTIPDGIDLTKATYVGIAKIAGFPDSRIQIAVPIVTNKNELLEEMIALAEEAEVLGNPAWTSCQKAVAAFTPFEEKKDEIKTLISELKAKSYALNALSFKVEVIPGKLRRNLTEEKRRVAAIEKYAEQIKQLKEKICEFGDSLSSKERGQQIGLMAQIYNPLSQLQKQNRLLSSDQDKAQKELALWEKFDRTLDELDALINGVQEWAPPLVEQFADSTNQLAAAEKNKRELGGIKAIADRLLRQAEDLYSQPESAATLLEIKVAHGRVLHPLSEVSDCLKLATDKRIAVAPLGAGLTSALPSAEKTLAEAAKTKKKIDGENDNFEKLTGEFSAINAAASEIVLEAENDMSDAQTCYDPTAAANQSIPVPDLIGKTATQARQKLATLRLEASLSGGHPAPSKGQAFHVASQDPEVGTLLAAGETVTIVIFSNYLGISVPDVVGLSTKKAKAKVITAGLTPKLAGGDSAPEKSLQYTVQSQRPVADEKVAADSSVTIKVYGAVEYKSVPAIVGLTAAQAKSSLTAAGLQPSLYGGNAAPKKALSYKIAEQSPEAGAQVISGSIVTAYVYGNFDKEAALAQKTCESFPGTSLQWDDVKEVAWCVCPAGQILSNEKKCVTDPKIAERRENRQNFWNAVVSTAVPMIIDEMTSGGNSSNGGSSGNTRSGNSSNTGNSGGGNNTTSTSSTSSGNSENCELKYCPSCADTGVDLFQVAVNSQCTNCRQEKSAQIASCARGESSGQGTKYVPKDYIVMCDDSGCSIVKTTAPRTGRWEILFGPDSWSNCHDAYPDIF